MIRHMAILNNTLCDKCRAFDRCDEQYGDGVPPCAMAVARLRDSKLANRREGECPVCPVCGDQHTNAVKIKLPEYKEISDPVDKLNMVIEDYKNLKEPPLPPLPPKIRMIKEGSEKPQKSEDYINLKEMEK